MKISKIVTWRGIAQIALIWLCVFGIVACVVTLRTKSQKTKESEVQIGVASPNSEFSQSQINSTHIHNDTVIRVRVKKDTIEHEK